MPTVQELQGDCIHRLNLALLRLLLSEQLHCHESTKNADRTWSSQNLPLSFSTSWPLGNGSGHRVAECTRDPPLLGPVQFSARRKQNTKVAVTGILGSPLVLGVPNLPVCVACLHQDWHLTSAIWQDIILKPLMAGPPSMPASDNAKTCRTYWFSLLYACGLTVS